MLPTVDYRPPTDFILPILRFCNTVHGVNANEEKSLDSYRALLLMSEIATEEPVSQRELARRLGIALGLVNSYLKNLVSKGFVRVKNFPRNRYAYLLTPKGFAEKSRLAYQHLKPILEEGDPYYNPNLSLSLRVPTLRRPGEVSAVKRVEQILEYAG